MVFEGLVGCLGLVNRVALGVLEGLSEADRRAIGGYYADASERYWALRKLFALAVFLPVFLRVGRSRFDRLVYVGTHAGVGPAKVGGGWLSGLEEYFSGGAFEEL